MHRFRNFQFILFLFPAAILLLPVTSDLLIKSAPLKVEVSKSKNKYGLLVNGKPYYIKGAGGYENFERLKEIGGNSVRLWTTENVQEYLDKAHAQGLTVTLGLHMQHERLGFDYNNKKKVAEQFEHLKKEILKYKDHPALLMWGVGNEVDQFAKNYNVWNAVEEIAKFIHQVDPNHPTTTMLAGVPPEHVEEIVRRCKNLDILSINSFMDLPYIKFKITEAGWKGPYLIGEWGASGYWETPKTPWGIFIEETSTEKARVCQERYEKAIASETDRCLGSYIFYWGYKQARTHTLLSLFLESGEEIEVVDVLHKEWTGQWPANRCPQIKPIGVDNFQTHKGIYLKPGSQHNAFTDASDADSDSLSYYWEIFYESKEKKEGGDKEAKPAAINGLIVDPTSKQLSFIAPNEEGAYRLFVYVFDGHNHVATANAPFYVKP